MKCECGSLPQCGPRSFSCGRIDVENQPLLQPRLDHVHQRMMQYPLAERRRANDPFLRFVHREPFLPPDRIRAIDQSVAHFLEFRPKVRLVRPLIIATPLPAARLPKGEPQILRLDHLFKQVADSLRFIALSFAAAAPFAPLTPASAGAGLRRPRCDSVF